MMYNLLLPFSPREKGLGDEVFCGEGPGGEVLIKIYGILSRTYRKITLQGAW